MLKAQLARALQLPLDTRAEQGLHLLRELEERGKQPEESDEQSGDSAMSAPSEARDCDRVIAMLRARLTAR